MAQQRADYPLDYSKGPGHTTKDDLRERAESANDRLRSVAGDAQEIAGKVAEQAREYGEKGQQLARQFKPFVEKSVKERPMSTLATAAVIGFALGALWKK